MIKLYEVYEGEKTIYLVQELLRGGELFEKLNPLFLNYEFPKGACYEVTILGFL